VSTASRRMRDGARDEGGAGLAFWTLQNVKVKCALEKLCLGRIGSTFQRIIGRLAYTCRMHVSVFGVGNDSLGLWRDLRS
jgi:hypothetical protein